MLIKIYQYCISPLTGPSCRFYPTCSEYMSQAIKQHGLLKGVFLGFKRLSCCHPWCKSHGHDPVPENFEWSAFLNKKQHRKMKH